MTERRDQAQIDRDAELYMQKLGMKPKESKGATVRKDGFVKHPDGGRTLPRSKSKERYYSTWLPRWLHIEIEYRAKKANQSKSEWLAEQLGIKKPS